MSERRRRISFYEVGYPPPIIEERRPERARTPERQLTRTIILTSTPVHRRRKERVERSPSPVLYTRRPRAPTPPPPPPRVYHQQSPVYVMPPKQTSLSKALSFKKDDNTSRGDIKYSDKVQKEVRTTVYQKGHKPRNSADTGYGSGFNSPFSVEDRSPLDYNAAVAASQGISPQVNMEPYEIITSTSKRYVKSSSDRKADTVAPVDRKRDREVRYVVRAPDSPGAEDEYVPTPTDNAATATSRTTDTRKDRYAPTRRATQVLHQNLSTAPEIQTKPAPRQEESQYSTQIQQLQADLQRRRLERQIKEGRANEAERKIKQQQQHLDEVEAREKELKRQVQAEERQKRERERERQRREEELRQQQAEEQRQKREKRISRREVELTEQQWKEIEATPIVNPTSRRAPVLVDQNRRRTLMAPIDSSALTTTTQSPTVLDPNNVFFAPILEAQRDEEARRAREAREERRRGTEVIETARAGRQRSRRDEHHK